MATYDKGDRIRVTATFTSSGTATDPTGDDVTVTWRKPSAGTDATPSASNDPDATGAYYVDLVLNEIGTHTVRFTGNEGVIASETVELVVAKSIFDHS